MIRTGLTWKSITKAAYWEALECLPPAVMTGNGFLLGEPYDHVLVEGTIERTVRMMGKDVKTKLVELPRFHAFVKLGGKHYASNEPMTTIEFRALVPADIKEAA